MNEIVKAYLDVKKEEERKRIEEKKRVKLAELGLYEKEYSPDNRWSEEYPECQWDGEESKWYKIVPIEISDEEYEEIMKYSKSSGLSGDNVVATILSVIAYVLFAIGFIAGLAMQDISFTLTLTYWCVSFVSGITFIGFAEIIKLLEAIRRT